MERGRNGPMVQGSHERKTAAERTPAVAHWRSADCAGALAEGARAGAERAREGMARFDPQPALSANTRIVKPRPSRPSRPSRPTSSASALPHKLYAGENGLKSCCPSAKPATRIPQSNQQSSYSARFLSRKIVLSPSSCLSLNYTQDWLFRFPAPVCPALSAEQADRRFKRHLSKGARLHGFAAAGWLVICMTADQRR
jgi:hypothetical protein